MASPLNFQILKTSDDCDARVGRVNTVHGSFETPAFMPVGTSGAVKGLLPDQVAQSGAQIILANCYHLMLRPGSQLIAGHGGLHKWMRWGGPILTDSGGFQVFSLAHINEIGDHGINFRSHVDGQTIDLTPQRSIQVQNSLGADIIMPLDDCPPACGPRPGKDETAKSNDGVPLRPQVPPGEYEARVRLACQRTVEWLKRCVTAHARPADQALFGIVQGGTNLELRSWCAGAVCQYDLPGYAIGGVAVGESYHGLRMVVEHTAKLLPSDRPRYLMGVGYERDILAAVRAGVDMFDCVLPTRNGRNAFAFTPNGSVRLRNAQFAGDPQVIDQSCDCPACRGGFPRSYLRHLFQSGEMLGPILVSLHNLRHFQRYLLDIREAITHNDWLNLKRWWPVANTN